MENFLTIIALAAAVLNGIASIVGALLWWRVEPKPLAWALIRAGQAGAVALAVSAGAAWFSGHEPDSSLFWIYALVPVGVGFFAEQFRILSAQTVLEARELEDAAAVGRLPADEQRSVVLQIARRELGVMALAAGVIAFLALRAVMETGGL
ncbi:MAG TPA: hypothetical protein VN238_10160 [Solirubrobacteraceae bacterium]|nr:hypothetical protein [Solirubrobacteraceae bacterium]